MEFGGHARLAAAGVSAREAQVLAAIGRRLANREIAAQMFISVRTVESHVSSLLRKLGLADRPALIRFAQQLPGEAPLPVPNSSFVGRDDDLATVAEMLKESRLICLVGAAGCGKTRLAQEAARQWHAEVRLVDLASASEREVGAAVAAGLGIGVSRSELAATAQVALAGRDLLLVADNCDHVVTAAAQVLDGLAQAAADLRILATCRQPLGANAERVLPISPLPVPADGSLREVRESPAGKLFLDRARASSPAFTLDDSSAPHIAAICRHLDGLPLAVELAAARARGIDIAALAESITQRFELLEQPARTGRHRSVAAAIEWSWELLDNAERELLGRLAALPGEFTLDLAEAVAGQPPAAGLRSTLMRLVDRSLVSVRLAAGEPARYRLLGVIRSYAGRRAAPPVASQVRGAHARFQLGQAEAAVREHRHLATAPRSPAGADEANLLAALTWAATHDPPLADNLLGCVAVLAERQPAARAIETIRDVVGEHPGRWSSEALAKAGIAVTYLDLDAAARIAGQSRLLAADQAGEAYADWVSGWIHAYRHQEGAALSCLDRTISYARISQDVWLEGSAWQARGLSRSRAEDAFDDWERAVALFAAAGDLMHANNVRYMLASRAVQAAARLAEVPLWLGECEAYASRHGYQHELAHAWLTRAAYERASGLADGAEPLLERSLLVFGRAGDLRCVGRTLLELAIRTQPSDPAAAVDLLLQGLRPTAVAGDPALRAQLLTRLVAAAAAIADLVLAARCLGALEALSQPSEGEDLDPDLTRPLTAPAYATFRNEGRIGGFELLMSVYPR